tara:strand:+ start:161 stop:490 length:330 start_codon:yes stop_codon:yes gene_type:complete
MKFFFVKIKNKLKNILKKLILLLIPFCLISVPKKALAENNLENSLQWFFEGVTWTICNYYKEGYLPDEKAKKDVKYWFSIIDRDIKTKKIKDTIIAEFYKEAKCRNLMP